MGGTTKKIDTTPADIQPLRSGLVNWLTSNPTPPSVGGGGGFSGTAMPTPVPQNPSAGTPTQGFTGGPGVGYGGKGGFGAGSVSSANPYGGYTPESSSAGNAAIQNRIPGGGADSWGMPQWQQAYQESQANPYLAGSVSAQGIQRLYNDYISKGITPDRNAIALQMGGAWLGPAAGPQTGGLTPGNAAGGFYGNNPNQINTSMIPGMQPSMSYAQSPMLGPPPQGGPQMGGGLPQAPAQQGPQITPAAQSYLDRYFGGNLGPSNSPMSQGLQQFFSGGGAGAGGAPQGPMDFGGIFAQRPDLPGRVQIGLTPDTNRLQDINAQQIDINSILNLLGPQIQRNQIRDVAAQNTQSVDQLGGVNSEFFNNMMGQLSPAFAQRRAEALAAAKESSGNLTGSGYANALGGAVNRSLGDEQAMLANYASQGLNTEVGRQLQQAALNLQGQGMNQGADMTFLNQLLSQGGQRAGLAGNLAQANQGANLNAQIATQGNELQRSLGNRQITQGTYNQQAGLDQQRNLDMWNQLMGLSQGNAQNFLQLLLGLSTTGVGPQQVVPTTWGSILNSAGQIGGMYAGKKWG